MGNVGSEVLFTVSDWERVTAREVPEREGRPFVGVDLGGGRAWSAAVALWSNGRVEALAVAPGIPTLDEQEKRDRVPAGTYSKLHAMGQLDVAEGLRVQPPAALWDLIKAAWGRPLMVVLDRFRLAEFEDAVKRGARLEPRVSRWSEASFDIRALRQMALDGPLAVDEGSQALIATSLSQAMVKMASQPPTARSGSRPPSTPCSPTKPTPAPYNAPRYEPETQFNDAGVGTKSLTDDQAFGRHPSLKQAWLDGDPITVRMRPSQLTFKPELSQKLKATVLYAGLHHRGLLGLKENQVTLQKSPLQRADLSLVGVGKHRA